MKAFLYPGQGAQFIGMGADLFKAFPDDVARADTILGYSIESLCLNGPADRLIRTNFTQPALYVVCALEHQRRIATGLRPDIVLGHSVGEYVALFAANVFDFETGLRLVQKRGALMGMAVDGGMAAIMGLGLPAIQEVISRHHLVDIHPANLNTPHQTVVSGKRDAIVAAEHLFLSAGASHYIHLRVGGAFHTPFMREARQSFAAFAADISFAPPQIPVISNVTARPHVAGAIRERLVEQITAPVKWCESVRYLLAQDMRFEDFMEVGPGGSAIVKPMVKRIEMEAGPLTAMDFKPEEKLPAPSSRPSRGVAQMTLGSRRFCEEFGLRHPYLAGAMYRGVSSVEMVISMARAGMLAFFGAGGLPMSEIASALAAIRAALPEEAPFGVNFTPRINRPHLEDELVDLLLTHGVHTVEASAFIEMTPALVRYRAHGLAEHGQRIHAQNRIVAKVSHPDVAARFLAPAPEKIVSGLLDRNAITVEQAELLRHIPLADAICVEADSGGHTDRGMPFTLIPAMLRLRDATTDRFPRFPHIYVGAGGGIGTPEAAAAVFMMGADFVVTGSINQCTVEARTSAAVKDLLQDIGVRDTTYAPSGEMFELGAKVQVLKKGLLFPARAEKLASLYHQYDTLEAIDAATRRQLEERYFRNSFEAVYEALQGRYSATDIERADRSPKQRMALVFKHYFSDTNRWALSGDPERKVDYQIHCGSALGAFNQWIGGTTIKSWRERHVDSIALNLLDETAWLLGRRFAALRAGQE